MTLPFSQACENNKDVILAKLKQHFENSRNVLEIGSGTGQHAVHFALGLPHLTWQCSDQPSYHHGINQRLAEYNPPNVVSPIAFTLPDTTWPEGNYDGVFTANTAHIMQKSDAEMMMKMISEHLPANGVFCQYGPFTFDGEFTSESNEAFHNKLISEGYGGYRDIEELKRWAQDLVLTHCFEMPANNNLLVWHSIKRTEKPQQ